MTIVEAKEQGREMTENVSGLMIVMIEMITKVLDAWSAENRSSGARSRRHDLPIERRVGGEAERPVPTICSTRR